MYARLWWKDVRQFWPIWSFLLVASIVAQALLLRYAGTEAREGGLVPFALSFVWLYGVAVGAAAFAGERENGTLRFLDILPVDRWVLWQSKAAFGLVSMVALALVVLIPAAWSTQRWEPNITNESPWLPLVYFVVLVEGLAWGLFASAISKNALTASLIAACCSALSLAPIFASQGPTLYSSIVVRLLPWRLIIIAVTAGASAAIMVRTQRGGRSLAMRVGAMFRSPVVVRSPIAETQEQETAAPAYARPRRLWAWWPEIRSIAWLSAHQGWRLWVPILAFGVAIPLGLSQVTTTSVLDFAIFMIAIAGVAILLAAGVNIFGAEHRGRTNRFLTHHGARPGLVWGTKLSRWFLAAVLVAELIGPTVWKLNYTSPGTRISPRIVAIVAYVTTCAYVLSCAIFCGMVIRRGITAWVVSLLLLGLLLAPQYALIQASLMSPLGLAVLPFALIFLTWTWRKDWMYDLPAPGRWIRLGVWSTATFAVLFAWYAGDRAWGIPATPALTAPASWANAAPPDDQNAAKLYEEIQSREWRNLSDSNLRHFSEVWGANPPQLVPFRTFLSKNTEAYEKVRKAAAMPICRFVSDPAKTTEFSVHGKFVPLDLFARVLAIHAGELGRKDDLAGAWEDIEAILRIARQQGQDSISGIAIRGIMIEEGGLSLAMEWAADSRQKPETLRAALEAYRKLPPMISPTEVIRAEANILERTLDLPRAEIRQHLAERLTDPKQGLSTWMALGIDTSTTPWEIERARRANRTRFNAMLEAAPEPSRRNRGADSPYYWGQNPNQSEAKMLYHLSPNVWYFVQMNDRNEVGRRALEQILALRIWQLEHGGKLPESLNELIPSLLPRLPHDPYASNLPFRYIKLNGNGVPPLGLALSAGTKPGSAQVIPTVGYRLLYSIGINKHDNNGTFMPNLPNSSENDIIFPLKDDVGKGDTKPTP